MAADQGLMWGAGAVHDAHCDEADVEVLLKYVRPDILFSSTLRLRFCSSIRVGVCADPQLQPGPRVPAPCCVLCRRSAWCTACCTCL